MSKTTPTKKGSKIAAQAATTPAATIITAPGSVAGNISGGRATQIAKATGQSFSALSTPITKSVGGVTAVASAASPTVDENTARFNEQAFLMLNINDLVNFSKNNAKRFKNFTQIDVSQGQSTAEFNSILFKNKITFDMLLNTTSLHMSTFLPKIRLFKEYDYHGNIYSFEFPLYEGYEKDELQSIFQDRNSRGGGVGLKNFSWSTIGNSSGNQYSFEASVELFFESIEEITKIRYVHENKKDEIGIKNEKGEIVPLQLSFSDLLIQSLRYTDSRIYNPNYFKIKAIVGWHTPDICPPNIDKELFQEIKNSNIELHMSIHSHEIDIADDSTVTLKIKYIAYIESLAEYPKKSNIFYSDMTQADINSVETLRKDIDKAKEELIEIGPDSKKEEKIKELEKNLEEIEYADRERIYTRIMNYLYDNNLIKYYITTDLYFNNFISLASTKSFPSKNSVEYYKKQMQQIITNNSKLNMAPISAATGGTVPTSTSPATTLTGLQTNIKDYTENSYEELLKNTVSDPNKIPVPYFFLGDLLDSILSGMFGITGFKNKELKVVLGPVTIYDYGQLADGGFGGDGTFLTKDNQLVTKKTDGSEEIKVYSGIPNNINVADIPISLAAYNAWFLKEIVNKNITVMTFKDFINQILNNLVVRCMGPETYAFAPRHKTRLVYKTKTLPERLDRFEEKPDKSLRYNINEFKNKPFVFNGDDPRGPKKLENFVFIYSLTNNPWDLKSNYEEDIAKGIRHLRYGSETGLIKNIKFKRQDNKHIRTHNIKIASSLNADRSVILREVYNADVSMFGNNIFEIGEIVYISPTLFGSSTNGYDREKFAKSLGIGGYFLILKINNSISQGSFETNLTLQWMAKGDGLPGNILQGKTDNTNIYIL